MVLSPRNKLLAAGGVAVVLVLAWFALSQFTAGKAEERIEDLLDEHGLNGQVSWKSVSASPFGGSIRLQDVTLGGPTDRERVQIARVEINDLIDDRDRKRAEIRLDQIASEAGGSPLGGLDLVRASGRTELPPANATIRWDADLDDDELVFRVAVDQPGVMRVVADIELEKIAALARIAESGLPGGGAPGTQSGRARPDIGNPMAGLGAVFGMMEVLGEVRIRRAEMALRDDGYVKRSVALHKRYMIPVSPAAGGQPSAQRDEGFKASIQDARASCEKELPVGKASERGKACETIIDFVSGAESSVSLRLAPERPVSLSELMELVMQAPDRAARLLRPEFGS
jgi:hypothetical protein